MDGLFGNLFDINGDGELSTGERMMDFALFHHMVTERVDELNFCHRFVKP